MTLAYKAMNCDGWQVYLSRALQWKTSTRQLQLSGRQLVVFGISGDMSGIDRSMPLLPQFGMTCRHQSTPFQF